MSGATLVAYATRYGSTREVAEIAAETLRQHGLTVEVKAAKDAVVGDGHDGVLLATPFYMGSMLKDAVRFLGRHRAALEQVPVALLACGPLSADDDLAAAREQLDGALAKLGWLHPVAAEMFVGKYDPAHLRMADRLIAALPASPLHGVGAHDDRDWEAIRAWAATLPPLLCGRAQRPPGAPFVTGLEAGSGRDTSRMSPAMLISRYQRGSSPPLTSRRQSRTLLRTYREVDDDDAECYRSAQAALQAPRRGVAVARARADHRQAR